MNVQPLVLQNLKVHKEKLSQKMDLHSKVMKVKSHPVSINNNIICYLIETAIPDSILQHFGIYSQRGCFFSDTAIMELEFADVGEEVELKCYS